MKELKVFEFSGSGKYSIIEQWDTGLKAEIIKIFPSYKSARMNEQKRWGTSVFPETPWKGVYDIYINEYIESRYVSVYNVSGYVVAEDKKEAYRILMRGINYLYPEYDLIEDNY